MSKRTPGNIHLTRRHSNPETAKSLIELCADKSTSCLVMADMYCAEAGSEQEANAEFIVRAWNSHDDLLAAAQEAIRLIEWLHLIAKDGVEIHKHELRGQAEMFEARIAPAITTATAQ